MKIDQAMMVLSREERFMASVYALRTVLVEKGIVSSDELNAAFCEWTKKELRNREQLKNCEAQS